MKQYLFAFFALVAAAGVSAQDQIHKLNKEILKVRIVEIGTEEITYREVPDETGVLFNISTDLVEKIVFENGKEHVLVSRMDNPDIYAQMKDRAWKFDFFSPMNTNLRFGYQQMLKPGVSYQANLGIIGVGMDLQETNPGGAFIQGGMRFQKAPEFYTPGQKRWHPLNGKYVQPTLTFGYFEEDEYVYDYNTPYSIPNIQRRSVFTGAVMLQFGNQWVMGDSFIIDFETGVGYCFTSDDFGGRHFAYITGGNDIPVAFNFKLNVGLLTH